MEPILPPVVFITNFVTDPFIAHSVADGDQTEPEIIGLLDGSFFAGWQGDLPFGDTIERGGFLRGYLPGGVADDVEFPSVDNDLGTLLYSFYQPLSDDDSLVAGVIEVPGFAGTYSMQFFHGPAGADATLVDSAITAQLADVDIELNATSDGGWVVTYMDAATGLTHSRYDGMNQQVLAPSSVSTGQPIEVITDYDVAALAGGGWVTIWQDETMIPGIMMRQFGADGVPVAAASMLFIGNSNAKVEGLADGGYVVVYDRQGMEGPNDGDLDVYFQRFAADGSLVTAETRVNNSDLDTQSDPEIHALDDGGFVVVWDDEAAFPGIDDGPAVTSHSILLQRYDAAGQPVGGNQPISVDTDLPKGNPTVELLADGRLVVGWEASDFAGQGDANVDSGQDIVLRVIGFPDTYGTNQPETLAGDAEGNGIWGRGGADNINGQGGNDSILGGFGNDTINGGSQDDFVAGEDGADLLFGGSGDDTVTGGTSNDSLFGGTGADWMDGGNNSDIYFVDGGDTVFDSGVAGFDKAQINNAAGETLILEGWGGIERINGFTGNDVIDGSMLDEFENLVISGDGGNDEILGGAGDDILLGGAGDDTIKGGDGNDTILGGTENDSMEGGAGNDVFFVGESGDVVADGGEGFDKVVINNATGFQIDIGSWTSVERINGFTGNDSIDATGMATDIVIATSSGADWALGGDGDDTVYAGSGDDIAQGGAGNDALIAGSGADVLIGGAGDDFMLGGADADIFVFRSGFGQDVIRDFAPGADQIDFIDNFDVNELADLIIVQDGANTVMSVATGGTDQITLIDFDASDVDASDFLFTLFDL